MVNSDHLSPDSAVVAVRHTVSSDLGDEIAILNLESGEYFGLNPVGALVWGLLAQPRTLGELAAAVEREFDVDHHRCMRDLAVLIEELHAKKLVERAPAVGARS